MPIHLTRANTFFSKKCLKEIQNLSPDVQRFIQTKLSDILDHEEPANIKKLSEYPLGEYRLKIGDYRLLFDWEKKINRFFFLACRNRKDLY